MVTFMLAEIRTNPMWKLNGFEWIMRHLKSVNFQVEKFDSKNLCNHAKNTHILRCWHKRVKPTTPTVQFSWCTFSVWLFCIFLVIFRPNQLIIVRLLIHELIENGHWPISQQLKSNQIDVVIMCEILKKTKKLWAFIDERRREKTIKRQSNENVSNRRYYLMSKAASKWLLINLNFFFTFMKIGMKNFLF